MGESFFSHGDGEVYGSLLSKTYLEGNGATSLGVSNDLYVTPNNGEPFARAGQSITVQIDQMYFYARLNDHFYGDVGETHAPSQVYANLYYTDGSKEYQRAELTLRNDNTYDIKFSTELTKDLLSIQFVSNYTFNLSNPLGTFNISGYVGEWNDNYYRVSVDITPEEVGLLSGILSGITSGFSALGEKISGVFDAIEELPSKIWEFIENGLKSLFVPDEEYIAGYKDRWEELLADRLGAVYQVVQITFGAWEEVGTADETNTITFPELSIPLPDNNSFTFGGYDVQIVPDGFTVVVDILKMMVGIACSFLFINGLRKRYDEVMGVEK